MKRIFAIFCLIIIPSTLFIYPKQTNAGVFDTILKGAACAGSKYAGQKLADYLTSKFGGALGGTVPVNDGTLINKFTYIDIINTCLVRVLFDKTTDSMLKVVRTGGPNGGPTWVQNWRNFRTEAQYRGEDIFRAMLSTTNLCDYFNSDLQKSFGVTQKLSIPSLNTRTDDLQSYGARAGCTLPKDFKVDKYQEDFANNGGWDAWNRLLETQNNPYGSSLSALDELDRQRSLEEQSALIPLF
ncbi:hypothetical protein KW791_01480, partial [Candidatus Parcubacteria bacterium]|nr:hypothetical protein [Candidatus Parcubacteria bacterium]